MSEFKLVYSGMQSGKTNDAAMRLAELARNYTSVEIKVVSEETKALCERIAKLERVREAAEPVISAIINILAIEKDDRFYDLAEALIESEVKGE